VNTVMNVQVLIYRVFLDKLIEYPSIKRVMIDGRDSLAVKYLRIVGFRVRGPDKTNKQVSKRKYVNEDIYTFL